MLEKPNLPDEAIITGLNAGYGLDVTALDFLPIGNDATAWLFQVTVTNGTRYFLKLKKGAIYQPGLTVPHYLNVLGIEPIVAPLPTIFSSLSQSVTADFALILYPFIEADNGMDVGLTPAQWTALGTVLQQIHALTPAVSDLESVRVETFTLNPDWLESIWRVQVMIDAGKFTNPFEQQFAAFWQARQTEITRIVDRAVQLGRWLQDQTPEMVLCHTDIHTANVLVAGTDEIHIVDWDAPLFAPRERDLMFVVERDADANAHFFAGYGETTINPLALTYYRYEWVVQEFGDYTHRVFLLEDVGDETRADAIRAFEELFEPGDVIAEAYKVEADLPADYKNQR